MGRQVTIKATDPQKELLNLNCKFPAFVAGYGAGKSEVMCDSALLDSMEGGAGSLIALYEPTYDLVKLILAPRICSKLDQWGCSYNYNKSENVIYTSSGQFGDFILRTLDNPERIVGYESFRAKIDELDTLKKDKAKAVWEKIIARNRQRPSTYQEMFPGKPLNTVTVFTTPEGFNFVHDRWVKNKTPDYQMIQAPTASNPFLPEDYVQSLRDSYPEQLIEGYLMGMFTNLSSGSIYAEFDRVKNNSDITENETEPLFVGMDFNVHNMSAAVHVKRGNQLIAVMEFSGIKDTPTMIDTLNERYPERRLNIYPDSSGKSNKSNLAGLTDISQLEAERFYTVRYNSVNPRVRDRINSVNALIMNGDGERRYLVNSDKCPELTDCLEQQTYDNNGEPDKKSGKDHMPDAMGYLIAYDYPIVKKVARSSRPRNMR